MCTHTRACGCMSFSRDKWFLWHRQHTWSGAILQTLGTTGSCSRAHVSPGLPLRSTPQQGMVLLQLQKQGPGGRIHPATPTCSTRLGWQLLGHRCPQAVAPYQPTQRSVSGLALSTAPGTAGSYRQLVSPSHEQIQAGVGAHQKATEEPGTSTGTS